MFKSTRPYNDAVTNYPKEPSLRIGKTVPDNAVNLAYYFNPNPTDAEKILTAEAPRNTIDHRIEEAYRYLFNQASDDDNLFPGSVFYEDEEGYQGRLGRMYVNWYPEAHVKVKNVTQQKDIIVVNKSEVPPMVEYSDAYGYEGNLYLDAVDFEVTKTKDVTTAEILDREVFNHELSYHEIFGGYINPADLDAWMNPPTAAASTRWPNQIIVGLDKCTANGGNNSVKNFVDKTPNPYDQATGCLIFDKIEYEQVENPNSKPSNGTINSYNISGSFTSETFKYTGDENDADAAYQYVKNSEKEARKYFKSTYVANYNKTTDKYDYTEIDEFLAMADTYGPGSGAQFYNIINKAKENNKDIAVYFVSMNMHLSNSDKINSNFTFKAKYKYKVSDRGASATYLYNVIATYKTSDPLKKTITKVKEVAAEYSAHAYYVGIARKVWYDYDGVAYYRGAVTKGNGVGNMNPEGDNELLMFSDENGYLRRPVYKTDENGEVSLKNFYRVEADYVYLTDVFKNGKACFYKYKLKRPIYDYRGPDSNGFYAGNAIQMFTAGLKEIPSEYEYSMKLKPSEYEIIDEITEDYTIASRQVPKRYDAELYTSFISSSTDTFKIVYNAFDDNDVDNVALDNGVTEEVYNYPFLISGKDFQLETVDKQARVNKIKLNEPYRIRDTRRYVTFTYIVKAEKKGTTRSNAAGQIELNSPQVVIRSEARTVSILNKDYALPIEYDKFEGRAMIISELQDGIYLSPFDMILMDQAARRDETVITSSDKDFIFSVEIVETSNDTRGAINIKCNPDGSGAITAETTIDTGFLDGDDSIYETQEDITNAYQDGTATFTRKLDMDCPYFVEKGYIYPGMKVKCIDSRYIKVNPPRQEGLLESWYPMIQFGHYSQILDQYGTHIKVCYTMPEYDNQYYSQVHGKPYVDVVEEKVQILNSHMVKTHCYPLFIREDLTTISLFKKIDNEYFEIKIDNISFLDGVIITKDTISENDNIVCNYTYLEENYIYRGYWRSVEDFARIDLNPNIYHTFSDMSYMPSVTKPSKNLFNKVIYFFMRPTVEYEVDASNDSLIYDIENDDEIGTVILRNEETLYHQINNAQPESDHDIYIGSVYIRQNTSLHSTILIDSRTRGGGIIESMKDSLRHQLEPESDFYLDIGYYDGEPYQENGVIVIRLDNSLLKEFGGRFTQGDIESKVKRWLGFGVYPIIEYVDSYTKYDMPQYTLTVQDEYTNVIDETPELLLECISIS